MPVTGTDIINDLGIVPGPQALPIYEVIAQAAGDMGRSHLDVVRFRRRYYDRWMERLAFLTGDYDFALEARRLVESALVLDAASGMPITGTDIINDLGIAPGP